MATLQVSATAGNDATADGTQQFPYKTINAASQVVRPGDTVLVEGGTYPLERVNVLTSSYGNNVTWLNMPGQRPLLDGGGTTSYAFFSTSGRKGNRIQGFDFQNYIIQPVHWYGTVKVNNDLVIDDCRFKNTISTTTQASHLYLAYGNPQVTNCKFENNTGTNESIGVWFTKCSNHKIDRCTFSLTRKEAFRDYFGLFGDFTNNFFSGCYVNAGLNESACALFANNVCVTSTGGVNAKHNNDPYQPAPTDTNNQNSVLYFWGLTEDDPSVLWTRIWHNTFYGMTWGSLIVGPNINEQTGALNGYSNQTDFRNNICAGPGGAYLWDAPNARTSKIIVDYNVHAPLGVSTGGARHLYTTGYDPAKAGTFIDTITDLRTALGWETHGQIADPLLNDPTNGDFSLKAGSPALAPGASLASQWGTQVGARGVTPRDGMFFKKRPMTALSSVPASGPFATVSDDQYMTGWLAHATTNTQIVYDAGSSVTVNAVLGENLKHAIAYNPKTIQIETGTSATGPWTVVFTGTIADSGGTAWPFEFTADATSRYWRYTVLTNWGDPNYTNLTELRLGQLVTSSTPVDPGPTQDTTKPTVVIDDPSAGASLSGPIHFHATASDNVGVAQVEFFVDGVLLDTVEQAPFETVWETTPADAGTRVLTARATDTSNNQQTSSPVTITVTTTADPSTGEPAEYWGVLA